MTVRGNQVKPINPGDLEGKTGMRYYANEQGSHKARSETVSDPDNLEMAYKSNRYSLLGPDLRDVLNKGETIERVTFKLPSNVEAQLSILLAGVSANSAEESYYADEAGGIRLQNIIKEAFMAAGYSETDAIKEAKKIVPANSPDDVEAGASSTWGKSGAVSYETLRKIDGKFFAIKDDFKNDSNDRKNTSKGMTLDQFRQDYPELYKTLFGNR